MWKKWLPNERYVTKPGGNLNRLKINIDVAKKEVYTAVMTAQESKLQEFTDDLQSESGRKNCFRIARQMAREGRDVISVCCMKNDAGNVVSDADDMKNIWRKYMEKLLLLFAFQSMFISIWVSRLEIAEFPNSIRRSAP